MLAHIAATFEVFEKVTHLISARTGIFSKLLQAIAFRKKCEKMKYAGSPSSSVTTHSAFLSFIELTRGAYFVVRCMLLVQ